MDKNDEIFYKYIGGKITLDEAYSMIKKLPKPWLRKKWKAAREIVIKDYCENPDCDKSSNVFVIQHWWHPETTKVIRDRVRMETLRAAWSGHEKEFNEMSDQDKRIAYTQHYQLNRDEIEHIVFKEWYLQSLRYMSLMDTVTYCKKCAAEMDKDHIYMAKFKKELGF